MEVVGNRVAKVDGVGVTVLMSTVYSYFSGTLEFEGKGTFHYLFIISIGIKSPFSIFIKIIRQFNALSIP